jgi:HAD superfamily hydrolase (TIGR01509 family)
MSGGLFARMLTTETGLQLDEGQLDRVRALHARYYIERAGSIEPQPGARELLAYLTDARIPWAIATSGRMETAGPLIARLGVDPAKVPVVTRDQVGNAKPDPDLFITAAQRLGTAIEDAWVVGDSVWDLLAARRARALGIGLLSGGYGQSELESAGAYRVYDDPAGLLAHIAEVGPRR